MPSAGILSPDSNKTISSLTISSIAILLIWPFLMTLAFILEDSSCNFQKLFHYRTQK